MHIEFVKEIISVKLCDLLDLEGGPAIEKAKSNDISRKHNRRPFRHLIRVGFVNALRFWR